MYGIIALLVSLPAGVFAARIGEKRALLIGLAVTASGLAALSQATRYDVALAFRALWLIGYRTAFIGVFTAMAIVIPDKYRSRTMGILGAMAAFASVIGAPFGTRVAAWLGWRAAFKGTRQSPSSVRSFSVCSTIASARGSPALPDRMGPR
jgi:predicted MFS family arabinose efflux permease